MMNGWMERYKNFKNRKKKRETRVEFLKNIYCYKILFVCLVLFLHISFFVFTFNF